MAGNAYPRAFLRIAGASLAQHQLGLALALKCHRIICLARDTSPELVALQQLAEGSGAQFYIASGPRQVAAQVTAKDDVFLVSDGLFVDPAHAMPLIENGRSVVLVQPAEGAQDAGFERIDLNRSAAGLARVPGDLLERLHHLPQECDTISSLTRIALQSRAEMREVPVVARAGVSWRMLRTEGEALEVEGEWLRQQFAGPGQRSPGRWIAQYGALLFGSSLLQVGRASNVVSAAVLVLLALAALLAWLKVAAVGFICAGLAWILVEGGRRLRAAERRPMGELSPAVERADALLWLVDAVLLCLVLSASPQLEGQSVLGWLFAPAMLFLVLSLAPRLLELPLAALIGDRAMLAIVFVLGALIGQVPLVTQGIALIVVLTELVLAKQSRV